MGTQILSGSKGFTVISTVKKPVVVTQDTCLEAKTIPVIVEGMSFDINIKMEHFIPSEIKTRDY